MSTSVSNDKKSTLREDRVSVIEINGYLFGLDILKSREVFPLPQITPVPNTSTFVIGVFNLRGEIYPLFDISTILGMPGRSVQTTDMVVLLEEGDHVIGILADRVHGVRMLSSNLIKPAQGSIPKTMMEYVTGMIEDKSSEVFLLNIERILSAVTEVYYQP
jgi:chemotaxis signal transduction protein